MQVYFTFPDELLFSVNLVILPRYNEIIDILGINDPSLFQSIEDYKTFENDHRLKTWKVNSVLYKLYPADKSVAVITLLEKEDTASYSH